MKGKSYFGYKFLFFIATVALIASAAARTYRTPFYFGPDPDPDPVDTPGNPDSLRFPIYDRMGDQTGSTNPPTIDLHDPSNVERSIEYDPEENRYYITEKIGNEFYRNPTYLTLDEYLEYQAKQDEQNPNEIVITELPIRMWTDDFKARLEGIIRGDRLQLCPPSERGT